MREVLYGSEFSPPDDWDDLTRGLIRFDKDKSDLVIDLERLEELAQRDLVWSARRVDILKAVMARVILEASEYGYREF